MRKYALAGRAKKSRGVHESLLNKSINQALFSSALVVGPRLLEFIPSNMA